MGSDRSKKGSIDEDIRPLLERINSYPEYETTSSCSGRIVLLDVPRVGDKKHAQWIYATHDKADADEICNILATCAKPVYFLQEPIILHVNCSSLESANRLLEIARRAGLKRSGIFSLKHFSVGLHGAERNDTILNKRLTIKYIALLVAEANNKLQRTKIKMKKLYQALAS